MKRRTPSPEPAPDARRLALRDVLVEPAVPADEGTAQTEAQVCCPYCGDYNQIRVDPSGGARQEYVEDCQVCCRPWAVFVVYGTDGAALVVTEPIDGT